MSDNTQPNELVVPMSDVERLLQSVVATHRSLVQTGRNAEALVRETMDLRGRIERTEGELNAAHAELNKFRDFDKDFPLPMRVKGLVDHARELGLLLSQKESKPDRLMVQMEHIIPIARREGCERLANWLQQQIEARD